MFCRQNKWPNVLLSCQCYSFLPRCKCGDGFDGPSCQGTTRSFRDGGYALLPTLKQCSETRTSVEFVTEKSSGILFYNGPTTKEGSSDYILLQLRNGKPLLNIDLGGGTETLEVMNSPALNDGKWHKVDIFRNNLVSVTVSLQLSVHFIDYFIGGSTLIQLLELRLCTQWQVGECNSLSPVKCSFHWLYHRWEYFAGNSFSLQNYFFTTW